MYRLLLFFILFLAACNSDKHIPDVSDVKVDLQLKRFEQDFFRIDTTSNVTTFAGLARVRNTYPSFYGIFMNNVLGINATSNLISTMPPDALDPEPHEQLKAFLSSYKAIYDTVQLQYKDLGWLQRDLEKGFQFVRHYYPDYKVPQVITMIGPINALANLGGTYTPNFIAPDFLGIGMQFYLGKNYSLYQTERYITEVAPRYRSIRFDREYIVPEVMQVVADDIYPNKTAGLPLVEQMVERGKQWWLVDHFLPRLADSLKTGYTGKQMKWLQENEGNVWAYLVKNENLYGIDPETIQNYMSEAPNTRGLPEDAPGNIGPWIGMRIVEKFAAKNEKLTLQEVLATPAGKIFEGSGYRPK